MSTEEKESSFMNEEKNLKLAEDFYNLVSVAPNLEFSIKDQDILMSIPRGYRGMFNQLYSLENPSIGEAREMREIFNRVKSKSPQHYKNIVNQQYRRVQQLFKRYKIGDNSFAIRDIYRGGYMFRLCSIDPDNFFYGTIYLTEPSMVIIKRQSRFSLETLKDFLDGYTSKNCPSTPDGICGS